MQQCMNDIGMHAMINYMWKTKNEPRQLWSNGQPLFRQMDTGTVSRFYGNVPPTYYHLSMSNVPS